MRRSATVLGAALACGLLLTGCGAEEGIPEGGTDRGLDDDASPSPTEPPPIDAGSEMVPLDCFDTTPSVSGVYQAGDAGVVTIGSEGTELVLVEVEPADGWDHEVFEEDPLRIEVRFRPIGGGDDDSQEDDDVAGGPQEHIQDQTDEDVITLVIASGPSADTADPNAELCTSLG